MRRLLVALPASVLLLAATAAGATWSSTAGGTAVIGAATMTNAMDFTVSCAGGRTGGAVDLAWTISPDAFVDEYEIVRTGGGGGTSATLRVPRTTAALNDDPPVKSPHTYTYTYTIRAVSTTSAWTTSPLSGSGVVTLAGKKCSID